MKFSFFRKIEKPGTQKKNSISSEIKKEEIDDELPWDDPVGSVNKEKKSNNVENNSFEHLRGICENLSKYLDCYNNSLKGVGENVVEIKKIYPEKTHILESLLNKFNDNINKNINIGKWQKTIEEIKNTGESDDSNVKRSLIQIKDIDERNREFKRMFFSELFSYFNNLLILLEEFSNIHRFINKEKSTVENIENKNSESLNDFLSMSETIGIHFDRVPLFCNYEKYCGMTRVKEKEIDAVYKEVKNLKKDDIIEIFSYGYNTDFTFTREDTEVSLLY